MSDDGDLCPSDIYDPTQKLRPQPSFVASKGLLPVILPAYDPPRLHFCSGTIDPSPLPRAVGKLLFGDLLYRR